MEIKNLEANINNYKNKVREHLVEFFGEARLKEVEQIVVSIPYETHRVFTVEDEAGITRFILNNPQILKLDETSPYWV